MMSLSLSLSFFLSLSLSFSLSLSWEKKKEKIEGWNDVGVYVVASSEGENDERRGFFC